MAKRRREAQQEFLYTIPVAPQVRSGLSTGRLGGLLGALGTGEGGSTSEQQEQLVAPEGGGLLFGWPLLSAQCGRRTLAAVTVLDACHRLVSDTLLLLLLPPHLPGW